MVRRLAWRGGWGGLPFLANRRLIETVDAVPEGLAFLDRKGRYTLWNARYAELAFDEQIRPGTSFESVLRVGLAKGLYKEAIGREEAWTQERLARQRSAYSVHEQSLSDGRWLRIEERRTAEGGTVATLVDITDLRTAREQAEMASRSKSEFLANMSHELRTPLNGVLGIAGVLAGTTLDERQREMIEVIESSATTLERLLSDILDLARVETGKLHVQCEPFHLGQAVRAGTALAELQAAEKGLAFKLDVASSAERLVEGDPLRLRQILVNLLSNAVKFTQQGGVTVKVRAEGGDPRLTFISK